MDNIINKLRVLIADSTPSVRHFIRHSLEDHFNNIEFEVANSGKNVKKRLESTRYDLVIYDRDMPLLFGDELLEWLRSHETLKDIPFIMISGDRSAETLKKIIALGADACLVKPLLMDPLLDKVREIFNKFDMMNSDRRKHERFRVEGTVYLQYNSHKNMGRLLNVSAGGILSVLEKNGPLPEILDRVVIGIETDSKNSIAGLEGEVVRIQAVDTLASHGQIQFALKFMDDMSDEKKRHLSEFLTSLQN